MPRRLRPSKVSLAIGMKRQKLSYWSGESGAERARGEMKASRGVLRASFMIGWQIWPCRCGRQWNEWEIALWICLSVSGRWIWMFAVFIFLTADPLLLNKYFLAPGRACLSWIRHYSRAPRDLLVSCTPNQSFGYRSLPVIPSLSPSSALHQTHKFSRTSCGQRFCYLVGKVSLEYSYVSTSPEESLHRITVGEVSAIWIDLWEYPIMLKEHPQSLHSRMGDGWRTY